MNPYERFLADELILRDELAIDRTLLANERTLLAYLRGGITLVLAGVTFIHFAHDAWFVALGGAAIPMGVAVAAFGAKRFRVTNDRIQALRRTVKTKAAAAG
jgi:putative membrane protein